MYLSVYASVLDVISMRIHMHLCLFIHKFIYKRAAGDREPLPEMYMYIHTYIHTYICGDIEPLLLEMYMCVHA
jgi:hypothetical protein